jgi:hypothetical protein
MISLFLQLSHTAASGYSSTEALTACQSPYMCVYQV